MKVQDLPYMTCQVLFSQEMKLNGIDLSSTTVSPKRGFPLELTICLLGNFS